MDSQHEPGAATPRRVLILDDNPEIARFIGRVVEIVGLEAKVTTSPEDFQTAFESFSPHVVILDVVMPDIDGIEMLDWLHGQGCEARIILVSGHDPCYIDAARSIGKHQGLSIAGTLTKPIDISRLQAALL